jgi:hypothetical protein
LGIDFEISRLTRLIKGPEMSKEKDIFRPWQQQAHSQLCQPRKRHHKGASIRGNRLQPWQPRLVARGQQETMGKQSQAETLLRTFLIRATEM